MRTFPVADMMKDISGAVVFILIFIHLLRLRNIDLSQWQSRCTDYS
ncbi:MAG: hypothetical protein IPL20_10995 [Saprospiraceae bacterium]|nr:hypothetical protein [Saprospiraceae bacterium]